MITLDVMHLRGMASGHRVAKSTQVRRNLKPPVAVRKGPTKSIATLSNGIVTVSLSCMGLGGGLDLSVLWHTSQFLIYVWQ